MMNSLHAVERASERLTAAGLDPVKVAAKADDIARAASPYWSSIAVLMAVLDHRAGDDRDDVLSRASNGDEVWAVIRGATVVTIMFRRSDQPKRPDCFGVEKVLNYQQAPLPEPDLHWFAQEWTA